MLAIITKSSYVHFNLCCLSLYSCCYGVVCSRLPVARTRARTHISFVYFYKHDAYPLIFLWNFHCKLAFMLIVG